MNDLDLKSLWQKQKLESAPALADGEQIAAMRKKMAQLRRGLNARDFRELAAGVVVVIVFAIYFVAIPHRVTRIGDLMVIGGALFASWKIIQSRRSAPQPTADVPVMEWLKYELAKVHQQAELLHTLGWWYVLPLYLGANVFYWGMPHHSLKSRITYSVVTALLGVGIYWLNQWARRKQLLPLQTELESLLQAEALAALPEEKAINAPTTPPPISSPPPIGT